MKTVAIIQARLGSSRLPGKVLLPIGGEPMLARVIKRVRRASRVDEVMVATTNDPADQPILDFAKKQGSTVTRATLLTFWIATIRQRAWRRRM